VNYQGEREVVGKLSLNYSVRLDLRHPNGTTL